MAYKKIMTRYDLFIFAGEASGDLHGESLLKNLYELNPDLQVFGVAGPKMRAVGLNLILPMEKFQVMGFVDVFLALPKITYYFYFLAKKILESNPKAVLFIDYPGFSLRLERYLKKRGYQGKIIHYICPSIWAHGKGRIALMEKNLDLLLTIFPFEKKYFSPNFNVEYVDHPLLARIAHHKPTPFPWAEGKKIISIFPGSREREIKQNLPLALNALKYLLDKDPNFIGVISVAQEGFSSILETSLKKEGLSLGSKVYLAPVGRNYDLMACSYFAIAKSGTVTLELALHKIPTVVIYGIKPLDLFIARRILRINLSFYCIVNILLNKEVFKEFIGPHATEENLLQEVIRLSSDKHYYEEKKKLCQEVFICLASLPDKKIAPLLLENIR